MDGKDTNTFFFLYMTAGSKAEAERLARDLVERRLVACANVLDPIQSFYWWEGKVADERESVVIAKTQKACVDAVIARVKEIHSYACPCVVAWPLSQGNPDFFAWIAHETSP